MKIKEDFLEPNFLTYSQTHSFVFGLNTAPGHNTLLLTPPSYKIALNKGTITRGRLSVNNRSCPIRVGICLNGLSVCFSKHQPFTRCCFQVSQNSIDRLHVFNINPLPGVVFKCLRILLDRLHVFLIRNLHKLADDTHNKGNIRTMG